MDYIGLFDVAAITKSQTCHVKEHFQTYLILMPVKFTGINN